MNEMEEIAAERRRQIEEEGWTPEHDDQHENGSLLRAATLYYLNVLRLTDPRHMPPVRDGVPVNWPWESQWWKPKSPHRDLVRAGALCLAEKARMERRADFRQRQIMMDVGFHHWVPPVRPKDIARVDDKLNRIVKLLEQYP